METITVNIRDGYEIKIDAGILDNSGTLISEVCRCTTAMIVSDDNVYPLYGERLKTSLKKAEMTPIEFVFPHGEQSKCMSTYERLVNYMCEAHMTRSDIVIALGGGVVGDLAGFAAATYQRGIPFIQIPTSLLADVDSSVGGKTGIDLDNGKNQVGCFHQPALVICDTDTLKTLPSLEYRNGCAEIIKYAMIGDRSLFDELESTPVSDNFEKIISRCVAMKRDFVEKDELDNGCRMMLNFGHTFGHAIEKCSGYTIPHGQAVAIGMVMITKASVRKKLCEETVLNELSALLDKYGLPKDAPFDQEAIVDAMMNDKKSKGDHITLVVPRSIGHCELMKISKNDISSWVMHGVNR